MTIETTGKYLIVKEDAGHTQHGSIKIAASTSDFRRGEVLYGEDKGKKVIYDRNHARELGLGSDKDVMVLDVEYGLIGYEVE